MRLESADSRDHPRSQRPFWTQVRQRRLLDRAADGSDRRFERRMTSRWDFKRPGRSVDVDATAQADALRRHGADVVVRDLAEPPEQAA
jgi:hypothetical protein